MSKQYGVLLSLPSIDFYNDSGWATLIQILKHMLKTLNLDDHVYHPSCQRMFQWIACNAHVLFFFGFFYFF